MAGKLTTILDRIHILRNRVGFQSFHLCMFQSLAEWHVATHRNILISEVLPRLLLPFWKQWTLTLLSSFFHCKWDCLFISVKYCYDNISEGDGAKCLFLPQAWIWIICYIQCITLMLSNKNFNCANLLILSFFCLTEYCPNCALFYILTFYMLLLYQNKT